MNSVFQAHKIPVERADLYLNKLAPNLADDLGLDHLCTNINHLDVIVIDNWRVGIMMVADGPGSTDDNDQIDIGLDPASARSLAARLLAAADEVDRNPRRLEVTLIAKGPKGEAVYARGNGGVFLYDPDEHRFWTLGNPAEDLRGLLDQTAYMGAMESLGVVPEIGLDAK